MFLILRSKIEEVLRNRIQSELMNTSYSIQKPIALDNRIDKQENRSPLLSVHDRSFFDNNHSSFVELRDSTLNFVPSNINPQPSILNDSFVPLFVKLAFISKNKVVLKDIPTDSTVLQLRYYLLLNKVITSYSDLSGWRLKFDAFILNDDDIISSLNIPDGALLTVEEVANDQPIPAPIQIINHQNAATLPIEQQNDGTYQKLVRTIDYSHQSHKAEIPIEGTPSDIPSQPDVMIHQVETPIEKKDYFPILRRPGYYMKPSHFDMQSMSEEEVAHIQNFTVGNEGAGEITWEGETNVCSLNLDDRIIVDRDLNGISYIQLYSPEVYLKTMPAVGEELNKSATVRLFNMFPRGLRSQEGFVRYENMLKRQVENMNGEWISYDFNTGVLSFKVSHFLVVCYPKVPLIF